MTTLTLNPKYVDLLNFFGNDNLEATVEMAVQDYLAKRINERIETARREVATFEAKYGMGYEAFRERLNKDDAFVQALYETDPVWDLDLDVWNAYNEVLSEWPGRLQTISNS